MLIDMRTWVLRSCVFAAVAASLMAAPRTIAIEWASLPPKTEVTVTGAALTEKHEIAPRARLELTLTGDGPRYGAGAALVTVASPGRETFTFFARDARREGLPDEGGVPRDPQQFEEPLHAAVLPVFSVESQADHVHPGLQGFVGDGDGLFVQVFRDVARAVAHQELERDPQRAARPSMKIGTGSY